MYTTKNFKTKKALREAIKNGERVTVFDPGPFRNVVKNGKVFLEGPHYPEPHKWYAKGIVKNGILVGVS